MVELAPPGTSVTVKLTSDQHYVQDSTHSGIVHETNDRGELVIRCDQLTLFVKKDDNGVLLATKGDHSSQRPQHRGPTRLVDEITIDV